MERCTVPITPANVHEILQYEPRFKVIICTTHKAAIRGLAKHLNRHHVASSAHKKYIVDKYSQYEVVDPRNVPLPEPLGPAFGSLGRPLQAYICEEEECEELSVSRDRISKHCRQNHAWRWSRDAPEYWHTVWVQTFFKSGGFQKYFTVLFDGQGDDDQLGEDQVRGSGDEDSALVRQQVDLIEDMWREEVDKRKEALEVMEASAAKQDRTGWYHRTGWHDHLRNSNMRHLSRAGRLGDRTEEHLQRAARLVNDIVERAAIGLKSIHPDTRRWLRSAKPNEADVRPFNRLQNPESQLTYGRYFQRLVCYLLRVCEAKMREEKWQEEQRSKSARKSDDDSDVDGDCDDDNASGERSAGDDGEQQQKDSCEDMATKGRRCRMGDMYDAVRLCPWTKEQLAKAIRLLQAVKHDSRGQEECLLDLMESLICQPLYNDVHQSPLVHFLAILGIDDETNRLRSANDFSYVLAGIVWVTRLLFVERYLPAAKREEQGKREIDNFLERRQAFLTDGSYSPMSTMLSLLAYGKSIAMKFSNAGMIQWSPDKQTMSIGGRPILMNRFKAMIDKVIMQAETTLWYNLMWEDAGSSSRFEVPLEDIEDDVTFSKRGYSFVDNKTNGLTDGRTWMLEKMLKSVRGRSLWRKDYTWDIRRVKGYLQAVETFLRSLLFAVHVSGGQPARGPEITSLRFKNGFLQDRNVFIIHGQVVTVTRYHKSASQFDSPKVVPRFLPWRVGQLMALYIAYIQPFQELLSVHVFGARWSEYIWSDARGHWETDKMSRIISTETSKHLGVRLTTLTYRHSAAAIGREKVGAKFAKGYQEEIGEVEEQEADDDLEDEVELGAGRSTAVGQLRYGVSGDVIKHLSQRNMNTFRPMCERWHEFLGLATYQEKVKKRRGECEGWAQTSPTTVVDHLQASAMTPSAISPPTRTSLSGVSPPRFTLPMTPAAAATQVIRSVGIRQSLPTPTSLCKEQGSLYTGQTMPSTPSPMPAWQFGLHHSMATPSTGCHERAGTSEGDPTRARIHASRSVTECRWDHERQTRRRQQRHCPTDPLSPRYKDVLSAMQHILGREEVSFRSPEQEEALSAVLEKQTPLVVVLPTGGGKSLLYTVPAWLNGKSRDMSIVVLPFRQLIENTLLRLKQVDVECREWRYGDTDPVTVLVVSADHLIDHNFLDYARQMQSKGLLTRVFVDECHLAFTAHHWRPKLAHMKNVRSICVPTVFLTATLPPALHWEFEESLSLRTVRYIHADTTRQRTRYFVHSCRAGTLLESVLASCQRRNRHFKGKEKGIVYCRRKDETEYLASRLGCGYVHAKASDNTASIQTWLSEGGFITATSSLGTGVDFPGVIHIIHAGMPYGMIDFAQESGRAGRAGEEVDSVIIIEDGWVEGQLSRGRMRSTDEMAMLEFVRTQSCRRAVYSKYLDGEATSCDDADRARCDRCGEGEVDIQRSVRVLAEDRDSVVALLDAISGGCVPCWLRQTLSQTKDGLHPTEWLHDDRDCRHAASTRPRKERLRTKMKFERKTHSCWRCSFSQKLCHTGRGGDEACQWPGVAMEVLIVAMENSWGRGIIRRLGYHDEIGAEPDAFSAWLGRRHGPRIWEEVMSNTMAVVLEFLVFCLTLKTSSVH